MAAALVQAKTGVSTDAAVTAAFDAATASGNLVVLAFASDDYNVNPDSGWTQSAGMEQQTFHGGYLWWRISTGQTSFSYSIGSAVSSVWTLTEWSGLTSAPYNTSNGAYQQASADFYTTPTLTPTAGDRLIIAAFGASLSAGALTEAASFTDSFTAAAGHFMPAAPGLSIAQAYLAVTADGTTGYQTTGDWGDDSPQSQSAMIIAFNVGTGGGGGSAPVNTVAPAVTPTTDIDPGDVISCSTGTWSNSPTGYTYQWRRGAINISGATSSTYTVVEGDRSGSINCLVTASNASGSASQASNSVVPDAYTNTAAPVINGLAQTGQQLTVTNGTWLPSTPTIITRQWKRNNVNISGATAQTYTLQAADEGQSIKCTVTGMNSQSPAYNVDSNTVTPTGVGGTATPTVLIRLNGAWVEKTTYVRKSGVWFP